MRHRHLNHQSYTLAAIDSVITRGVWRDWVDLRQAALADPAVLRGVARIANAAKDDPYFWMRYRFWQQWVARAGDPEAFRAS